MPDDNQLIRNPRRPQVARNKVPAMEACPQKRGCARASTDHAEKAQFRSAQSGRVRPPTALR